MRLFRAQCQTLRTQSNLFQKAFRSPLALMVAVLTLTSALGFRFYTTPKLDIGKTTTQTVYAPASTTVEDTRATDANRQAARNGTMPVWMLDQTVNHQIQQLIHQQLRQTRELRAIAGPFPYVKTSALSLRVQISLRKLPEADWQAILARVDPRTPQSITQPDSGGEKSSQGQARLSFEYKQAIAELKAYRRSVELGKYLVLIHEITEARSLYAPISTSISQPIGLNLPESFGSSLLNLPDRDWKQLETQVPLIVERMLKQGITPGFPPSLLNEAIKTQLKGTLSVSAEPLANQLLKATLKPNLIRDEQQTRLLAEDAAQRIKPVMVPIRKGEAIVRSRETITSSQFALLDHFHLSRRGIDWKGLLGFTVLVSGSVGMLWQVKQRFYPNLRRRDGILLWLLSVSTPLLVTLHLPSTNLPAVGLLIGGFFGAPIGITATGLLTLLMAVGIEMPRSVLFSSAIGGMLCGWLGGRLRSREELAILGVGVGVLQGAIYLLLNVASGTVWYTLLGASAFQTVVGLGWVIVGMGSSPLLEQVFDLITPIRLVELANPNRPLLKRLAAEAPGTFQHTLFVATLAEAAARVLGCNVELVRTGTLYHDIGKMHDPQAFIENQMGRPNKHELINHPWKSAEIIKKHVSEGLVMARKARLPKAVRAFIPEHQGTMLIAYFYHQAQQQAQSLPHPDMPTIPVDEVDFRYDGPIPQSRETGIVMLADSCEAALRSLKDATSEEAFSMINKILRARWQDNQLVASGLTRDEITQIAKIFVDVWQQFNHQRIAYPKLSPSPQVSIEKIKG